MAYQFTQTGQELQYLFNEVEQLAGDYDGTVTYAVGDYCNYLGVVYKCTASTTGTFDAADWTSIIVLDELEALTTRVTTAEGNITSINTVLTHVTDNGWSVLKYADGTFDAFCNYQSLTYGTGTAAGSTGLYFHLSSVIPMPTCAASITSLVAIPSAAQLNMVCGTAGLSLNNTCLYLMNTISTGGNNCPVFLRITGTWS